MSKEREAAFRSVEKTQEQLKQHIAESTRLIERSQELLARHRGETVSKDDEPEAA